MWLLAVWAWSVDVIAGSVSMECRFDCWQWKCVPEERGEYICLLFYSRAEWHTEICYSVWYVTANYEYMLCERAMSLIVFCCMRISILPFFSTHFPSSLIHWNQHSYYFQNAAAYASLSIVSVTPSQLGFWAVRGQREPSQELLHMGEQEEAYHRQIWRIDRLFCTLSGWRWRTNLRLQQHCEQDNYPRGSEPLLSWPGPFLSKILYEDPQHQVSWR